MTPALSFFLFGEPTMSAHFRNLLAAAALLAVALPCRADLLDAIHQGDVAAVRKLLKDDPKLAKTPKGLQLPLHVAARGDNLEIVTLLLDAGADVNTPDEEGRTALHAAANNDQLEIVKLLIKRGADVKAKTKTDSFTPLHTAAAANAREVMILLLASGADVNGGWDGKALGAHLTPILLAARNGSLETARVLLAKGANLTAKDLLGNTALATAVSNGDKAMVKLLLARGADPKSDNSFALALHSGKRELIDLFLAKDVTATTRDLLFAVQSGKPEVVELVLRTKVDVNAAEQGRTALMLAAGKGSPEVVALLLAKGADVKAADGDGRTALHWARNKEVAQLLLTRGAAVNAADKNGYTPLFGAVQAGDRALAELLQASGSKHDVYTLAALGHDEELRKALLAAPLPKTKDYYVSPLHLAARFGQVKTAQILLNVGATVSDTTRDLWTPLHMAAANGQRDMVAFLLEHKADVNARTSKDTFGEREQTPLQLALANGQVEVIELLRKHGALPKIEGAKLLTGLLTRAAQQKQLALVKWLIEQGAPVATSILPDQGTALHVAAAAGDVELAKFLLAKGADLNSQAQGYAPLHAAVRANQKAMVEFLLDKGAKLKDDSHTPALHIAAHLGHVEMAELLLAKGADPDNINSFGNTALSFAAQFGHLAVAKLLVAKGADLKKDPSVLHLAAFYGHRDIVVLLLDKGLGVETFLPSGFWLYYYPLQRHYQVLRYFAVTDKAKLKGLTANVTIRQINGKEPFAVIGGTPLQSAVAGGRVAVAELLLAKGAKVNVRFPNGAVPLHLAAELGDLEMVQLLIGRGGEVNARNEAGLTPLGVALERDEPEVAALLRQHGGKE
jgi:ankyrin repeat protein